MLQAEVWKLIKKRSFLVVMILTVGMTILVSWGMRALSGANPKDWRAENEKMLVQMQTEYKEMLEEREEGEEDLWDFDSFYEEEIAIYSYSLENDIPYGTYSFWNIVKECEPLLAVVMLIVMVTAIASIIDEYQYGTIKLIFTGKQSRLRVLLAKMGITSLLAIVLFALVFLTSLVMGGLLYGNGRAVDLKMVDGVVVEVNLLQAVFGDYLSKLVWTLLIVWIAMGIAVFTKNTALSILGGLFVAVGDSIFSGYLGEKKWYPFTIFPNVKTSTYLVDGVWNKMDGDLLRSVLVLMAYMLVFTFGVFWCYRKRDV